MTGRTIEAALTGDSQHSAAPRTAEEIAADAAACVARGANVLHLHAFDEDGVETLAGPAVDRVVRLVRAACPGVPLSMTTFAQIEPDPRARLEQVASWTQMPDFIPANQAEPGIVELTELCAARGVEVQACVFTVSDVELLVRRGDVQKFLRIAVEPMEDDPAEACAHAQEMETRLAEAGVRIEQLHHGMGAASWPVLAQGVARGHGIRTGLEDTSFLPDGDLAPDNAALIGAAVAMSSASSAG